MDTQAFFARVLPATGVKFIAVPTPLREGGVYWKHVAAQTPVQMARYAEALDAKELQVYFACASYENEFVMVDEKKKYRIRENVKAVKSFWLDIDCGEGKDYDTQAEGLAALERFLLDSGVPRPLVVNSGNGIHAYWSSAVSIHPDIWVRISTILREVCSAYGLRIDGKCTTDACRVLRPVGTHNRKSGAKRVFVIGEEPALVNVIDFAKKLKELAKAKELVIKNPAKPKIENDFAIPVEYPPVSAHEIRKHCQQVDAFATVRGVVAEPVWFNMLGLLKHTIEAETVCHDWSAGHNSYDRSATNRKIVQWSRGPATCESIRVSNPAGCEGCKHKGKINSPISLGTVLPAPSPVIIEPEATAVAPEVQPKPPVKAEAGEDPSVVGGSSHDGPSTENPTSPSTYGTDLPPVNAKMADVGFRFDPANPEFPASMREEFSYNGDVLLVKIETPSGVSSVVPMCDTIIWPISYHKNGLGAYHMVWRAVHHKKQYDFELSGAAIAIGGREIWQELGSRGIVPRPGKKKHMEAYVTSWFNELKRKAEETHVFAQFGWQRDGSFVVGNKQYKPDGSVLNIRLAGDAAQPSYVDAFRARGTVEEWASIVDRAYNYEGQEQYQFMLAVGFGAPLLRLFENYGGLTLNAYSPTKGLGKSTAGKLAIGIWGDPKLLIRTKQQTTYKAYIAHCGVMNSLPVMMDEATNIEGRELSDILYTFSQGAPRVILDRTGKMNMHQQSWSTMQISTANRSMVTLVGAMKSNADAEMGRIFEYEFSKVSKLTKEDADEILGKSETVFGAAGEVYAQYLVTHKAEIEGMLHDARKKLDSRIDLTVQDRFVSVGLSCIVVGAVIAKQLGLVGFDVERLVDWIVITSRNFKETVTSSTPPTLDVFGRMLSEITRGMIVTQNEGDTLAAGRYATIVQHPQGQIITGRIIEESRTMYIQQGVIRQWCAKNQADYGEMFRVIMSKKWVEPELVNYNLGRGTREYGMSSMRCWKINIDKMNGDSEMKRVTVPMQVVK